MDASRFDFLTKSLSSRLTRRGGLGLLGALGLAAWGDRETLEAKSKKAKGNNGKGTKGNKSNSGSPCRMTGTDAATTTTFTVKQGDLSLTSSEQLPLKPEKTPTSVTTVRQKRHLLLQTTSRIGRDGVASVEIIYGKAYKGIKRADLSSDGKTVWGTVDGRAIVPFDAGKQPEDFQFKDGRPAPRMSLSDGLSEQLSDLYTVAAAQAEKCERAKGGATSDLAAQSHTSLGCLTCVGTCAGGATVCALKVKAPCAAAAAACVFAAPACFAACMVVGFAACAAAAAVCVDLCARGPCCAVACHRENGSVHCCEGGQQCLRPGVCCPRGATACHGQECCSSPNRCMPDGTCCNDIPCGATCCSGFGASCCNGSCCFGGECIGGECCKPPKSRCGNVCCANTCCNGVCCNNPDEDCDPATGSCKVICLPNEDFCPTHSLGPQCCPAGTICCGTFCGSNSCTK